MWHKHAVSGVSYCNPEECHTTISFFVNFGLAVLAHRNQLKFPPVWMAASTWQIVHLEHEGYLYMV